MSSARAVEQRALLGALLDVFVPSVCAVCERPRKGWGGGGVCRACWGALPRLSPGSCCPRCALPGVSSVCAECRREPPPVARAGAVAPYAGGAAALVGAFKFRGFDTLAAPAARLLADTARRFGLERGCDGIVPLPSTRRRNRERGYDPGVLLARAAAGSLGLPYRPFLSRTRDTAPQSLLDAPLRRANVRGAFRASRRAAGRALLLIDDVVTTGATAFAAAEALLAAGARSVDLLAFARTPEPGDLHHPEAS